MGLSKTSGNKIFLLFMGFLLVLGTACSTPGVSYAQPGGNSATFPSPEEAVEAFVKALKSGNQNALSDLFGQEAVSQISSGDPVRDRADREVFLNAFNTKNDLERKGRGKVILRVGNEGWPFPVPLIKRGKAWAFDSGKGWEELLSRRIGRNELRVIETMEAYVDAQREYASRDLSGNGIHAYARKILSTPGKRDGLYWPVREGEEESPLGPLAAMAAREGYAGSATASVPFQGYYFRILSAQGTSAPGGAYDYVVKGNMILGFGLLAYPAKYGSSGIMTFMVNQQGVVYQKDFGEKTVEAAAAVRTYDPDKTWRKIDPTVGTALQNPRSGSR